MYASSGELCAEATATDNGEETSTITYLIDGKTYTLHVDSVSSDIDITCPNGQHVALSAAKSASIQSCQGGGYELCDGVVPKACTVPADCGGDQVCCKLSEQVSYCLAPTSCPDPN